MTTALQTLADVAAIIALKAHTWNNEDELQESIAESLKAAGLEVTREVALSGGLGRIDLMIGEHLGVEVKVKGSWQQLTRQVMRYSRAPEIKALLVVTTKPGHAQNVPLQSNGVPILTHLLRGAF
ncbi:Cas4 family exonuclease [Arthrobacter phage Chipper1996]|uniref:Cas4 family exonuclease n=2 Tax=Klausavirus princesstrina TaxID=1984784 RepID=A0A286N4A2_9CAUD|nr:Cas4 family exonuclease [Arthrobacter phage Tophat]QBP30461.1 Cas4 family exonuclease [Arthrobacter phage Chipper1996]